MLRFYYCLGHDIFKRMKENKYGSSFYKKLSLDLRKELPDVHSFSETNLKYMVYFYILNTNKNIDRFEGDLLMLPQLGAKSKDSNHPQVGDKLDGSNRHQLGDEFDSEILPHLVEELNIPPFNIPWDIIEQFIDLLFNNVINHFYIVISGADDGILTITFHILLYMYISLF